MKTIKSTAEISKLFEDGRRITTSDISLIVLRNENQHDRDGRVAFIAGKKLGNAVWRNRAKRRMRAVCKELGGPFESYDVVFLAKKKTTSVPYETLLKNTRHSLKRAGLLD